MLERALSRDAERIGFCHNDLQYGNIMIDEETRQVTIIVSYPFSLGLVSCTPGFSLIKIA